MFPEGETFLKIRPLPVGWLFCGCDIRRQCLSEIYLKPLRVIWSAFPYSLGTLHNLKCAAANRCAIRRQFGLVRPLYKTPHAKKRFIKLSLALYLGCTNHRFEGEINSKFENMSHQFGQSTKIFLEIVYALHFVIIKYFVFEFDVLVSNNHHLLVEPFEKSWDLQFKSDDGSRKIPTPYPKSKTTIKSN